MNEIDSRIDEVLVNCHYPLEARDYAPMRIRWQMARGILEQQLISHDEYDVLGYTFGLTPPSSRLRLATYLGYLRENHLFVAAEFLANILVILESNGIPGRLNVINRWCTNLGISEKDEQELKGWWLDEEDNIEMSDEERLLARADYELSRASSTSTVNNLNNEDIDNGRYLLHCTEQESGYNPPEREAICASSRDIEKIDWLMLEYLHQVEFAESGGECRSVAEFIMRGYWLKEENRYDDVLLERGGDIKISTKLYYLGFLGASAKKGSMAELDETIKFHNDHIKQYIQDWLVWYPATREDILAKILSWPKAFRYDVR